MSAVIIMGAQWGDEGKGKVVDWLSERADYVVRFQGGHNAGHTLMIGNDEYKLSLLPSGILRREKKSFIGNGVVVDLTALEQEMTGLKKRGVVISPNNFSIAENAALILPIHPLLDQAREKQKGQDKIGTTGRGIGPAYEDKVARRAIRMVDLFFPELLQHKIEQLLLHHAVFLDALKIPYPSAESMTKQLLEQALWVKEFIKPIWRDLNHAMQQQKKILFEGAQGMWLDIDHGTYPFVTSSSTVAANAISGSGLGLGFSAYVLGIAKAYTTRVGGGPFPTEQNNAIGELLGQRGHEFGTITGRKRRCGWFDAVMAKQACDIAGIHGLVLTKLDVLDGMPELQICIGYEYQGKSYDYLPAGPVIQQDIKPIYETLSGWQSSTRGVRQFRDLPATAIKYVKRLEELTKKPITLLSTSPERDDMIMVQDPFVAT